MEQIEHWLLEEVVFEKRNRIKVTVRNINQIQSLFDLRVAVDNDPNEKSVGELIEDRDERTFTLNLCRLTYNRVKKVTFIYPSEGYKEYLVEYFYTI
ncbi:MAG: hypothetical protein CEN90_429 [Parcubacteria group bacterium Licking1014_17]|nr:MAG: hypothetical protein CEN90_429 [Parcubacteria group bacterium Licking1014_17]